MTHFAVPLVQKRSESSVDTPAFHLPPFQYVGCSVENPSFHRWARHERTMFRAQRELQTEHWTKMRCRSYGAMKLGSRVWIPLHVEPIKVEGSKKQLSSEDPMATVECVTLDEYLKKRLPSFGIQKKPKKTTTTTSTKTPAKSSERAKLGFRYWYLDPRLEKRNPELKQNIGARGTYFGISFPR